MDVTKLKKEKTLLDRTIDALESIGAILQYIIYRNEPDSIDDELVKLDNLTAY